MPIRDDLDWAYNLPCSDRLHAEVSAGLPAWLVEFSRADQPRALALLQSRWQSVPPSLRFLSEALLRLTAYRVVGGNRTAVLELSDSPGDTVDWRPRPWCTPWHVWVDRAQDYLRKKGWSPQSLAELSPSETCDQAREVWSETQEPDKPSIEHEGRVAAYLGGVHDRSDVKRHVERVGLSGATDLVEFYSLFDQLGDSPPCVAGGFVSVRELRTVADLRREESRTTPFARLKNSGEWETAVPIYEGRNGDCIVMRANGSAGWFVHSRSEVRGAWNDLSSVLRTFLDHLLHAWPLDSYGIPSEIRERVRQRRKD